MSDYHVACLSVCLSIHQLCIDFVSLGCLICPATSLLVQLKKPIYDTVLGVRVLQHKVLFISFIYCCLKDVVLCEHTKNSLQGHLLAISHVCWHTPDTVTRTLFFMLIAVENVLRSDEDESAAISGGSEKLPAWFQESVRAGRRRLA